jgi:hypothetical protein
MRLLDTTHQPLPLTLVTMKSGKGQTNRRPVGTVFRQDGSTGRTGSAGINIIQQCIACSGVNVIEVYGNFPLFWCGLLPHTRNMGVCLADVGCDNVADK